MSLGDFFIVLSILVLTSKLSEIKLPSFFILSVVLLLAVVISLISPSLGIGYWSRVGFAPDLGSGIGELLKFGGAMAWMVVIYFLIKMNPDVHFKYFASAWIFTATFWAARGVWEVVSGDLIRAMGPFENPNLYASYLAFSLFLLIALFAHPKYGIIVNIPTASIIVFLLLVGIIASGSRGVLLGLGFGLFAIIIRPLLNGKKTKIFPTNRFYYSLGIALFGGLLVIAIFNNLITFNRVETSVYSVLNEGERLHGLEGRSIRWGIAIAAVAASPVFGIGANQLTVAGQYLHGVGETHNTFLSIMGELGLIGIIIFGLIIGYLWHWTFAWRNMGYGQKLSFVLGAFLLVVLIQGLFANIQHFRVLWISFGLILATKYGRWE